MHKRIFNTICVAGVLFGLHFYCFQLSAKVPPTKTDLIATTELLFAEKVVRSEVSVLPNTNPVNTSSSLFSECEGTRYINAITTHVLDYPLKSSAIVEIVSINTPVELLGKTYNHYYQIKIGDVEGFIHEDYLSETKLNYVTNLQNKIAQTAKNNQGTRSCEAGLCAAWVSGIYQAAGMGYPGGNAIDYWTRWSWSGSTGMDNIPIGAVVVGSGSGSEAGNKYGHVGIYIGNGMVADNPGYHRIIRLEDWAKRQRGYCNGYHGYIGWVWPYGDALGEGI